MARAVVAKEDEPVSAAQFVAMVKARMQAVSAIYDRIVYNQRSVEQGLTPPDARFSNSVLSQQAEAESAASPENSRPTSVWVERRRAPRPPGTLRSRRNLERFWQSVNAHGGTEQLQLSSAAIERAVQVVSVSDYALDVLNRSPELIAALAPQVEDRSAPGMSSPDRSPADSSAVAPQPDGSQTGLPQIKLRLRRERLILAAANILESRPVFEITEEITRIADASIAGVMRLVSAGGITVLALGRLGFRELDLLSDADLIFVRNPDVDPVQAFKQVEEVVNALGAYTREGAMFEVDLRLRPHGREGELVCTPAEVLSYFEREAQPWEALTYTKLRFVAGDEAGAQSLHKEVMARIAWIAARDNFVTAIREMRGKLELTHRQNPASKRRPGAFYDIDFLMATLLLRSDLPIEGGTPQRLQRLRDAERLSLEQYGVLREAAFFYRTLDHAIQVVTGRIQLPNNEEMLTDIADLMSRSLFRALDGSLQQEMEQRLQQVRAVYHQVLT